MARKKKTRREKPRKFVRFYPHLNAKSSPYADKAKPLTPEEQAAMEEQKRAEQATKDFLKEAPKPKHTAGGMSAKENDVDKVAFGIPLGSDADLARVKQLHREASKLLRRGRGKGAGKARQVERR